MSLKAGDKSLLVDYLQDLIRSVDYTYQKTSQVDFNMIKNLAFYIRNLTFVSDPLDVIKQISKTFDEYNPAWINDFTLTVNEKMSSIKIESIKKDVIIHPDLQEEVSIQARNMGYKVNLELSRRNKIIVDKQFEQKYPKGTSFYMNRYSSSTLTDYFFNGMILDKNTYPETKTKPASGCFTSRIPLERSEHTFLVIGDRHTWDINDPDAENDEETVKLGSLLGNTQTVQNAVIQNLTPSFNLREGCFYRTYNWNITPNPLTDLATELVIQFPIYNMTKREIDESNIAVHDVTDYVKLKDETFFVKLNDPDLNNKLETNKINDFSQIYKIRNQSQQFQIMDELIEILLRVSIDRCSEQLNIEYLQNILSKTYENEPDFLNGVWTDEVSSYVENFKQNKTSETFINDIVFKKTELSMLQQINATDSHGQFFGNW